jgi:hypothetical protein
MAFAPAAMLGHPLGACDMALKWRPGAVGLMFRINNFTPVSTIGIEQPQIGDEMFAAGQLPQPTASPLVPKKGFEEKLKVLLCPARRCTPVGFRLG